MLVYDIGNNEHSRWPELNYGNVHTQNIKSESGVEMKC